MLASPIRRLDAKPISDGACAMILASEEKAKKMCSKPAWVKGVGYRGEEQFFGDSDKAVWPSAVEAAKEAYDQAGITNPRKDLDVAEIKRARAADSDDLKTKRIFEPHPKYQVDYLAAQGDEHGNNQAGPRCGR